jgi:hypothetical protein
LGSWVKPKEPIQVAPRGKNRLLPLENPGIDSLFRIDSRAAWEERASLPTFAKPTAMFLKRQHVHGYWVKNASNWQAAPNAGKKSPMTLANPST